MRRLLTVLILAIGFDSRQYSHSQTNNAVISNEQQLLNALPQLLWTRDYMVTHGWLQRDQVVSEKANSFTKKNYTVLGVIGEIHFLFDQRHFGGERAYDVSFWVEGDEQFSKLYRTIRQTLTGLEKRSGDLKSGSRIDWTIKGQTNAYQVALVRRVFGNDVERSLEISIQETRRQH